jgi:hypothetical protein
MTPKIPYTALAFNARVYRLILSPVAAAVLNEPQRQAWF